MEDSSDVLRAVRDQPGWSAAVAWRTGPSKAGGLLWTKRNEVFGFLVQSL